MKHSVFSPYEQLDDIRAQLADAYDRGDTARLFELSSLIDGIQLAHWGIAASAAS